MFPPLTTRRPQKPSFRELVRNAVDTALEFATLGEATAREDRFEWPSASPAQAAPPRPVPTAPTSEHPHRRQVVRTPRKRRPGRVPPRAQACVMPVHRPARRGREGVRP
jgi:hypothetical protein